MVCCAFEFEPNGVLTAQENCMDTTRSHAGCKIRSLFLIAAFNVDSLRKVRLQTTRQERCVHIV